MVFNSINAIDGCMDGIRNVKPKKKNITRNNNVLISLKFIGLFIDVNTKYLIDKKVNSGLLPLNL